MNPRSMALLAVGALILVVSFILWPRPGPECPNHSSYPLSLSDSSYDTLPLSGPITAIPEFHDCQRLLQARGTAYGPLAGIWVAQDLAERGGKLGAIAVRTPTGDSGTVTSESSFDRTIVAAPPAAPTAALPAALPAAPVEPSTPALAFAIVYAWDGGYDPLGIRKSWNCLYVYPKGGGELAASMVPAEKPDNCTQPITIATLAEMEAGTTRTALALDVAASRDPELGPDDYPAVGRWDWDAGRMVQYIGLRCGAAWCEVTPKGSGTQFSAAYSVPPGGAAGRPVFSVKGWYDEQQLAVKPFWGRAQPASVIGTVVPDPGLGDLTEGSFSARWQRVGEVGMSDNLEPYGTDYGFFKAAMPKGTPPADLAQVSICQGNSCFPDPDGLNEAPACDWGDHPEGWYARITSRGHKPKYRCISRVDHSETAAQFPIPATARWFWISHDEKTWFRCGTACCTME